MHANVVSFPIPSERLEEATAGIRENTQNLRQMPGFQHGYWTYDQQTGTVHAMVIFDTAEQADAAWEKNRPQVIDRVEAMGGSVDARTVNVIHHL